MTSVTISPTPTEKQTRVAGMTTEQTLTIVIAALSIIIIAQRWQAIKTWIHERTK